MTTYTYTVFDGDPAHSGNTAWPSRTQTPIRARSLTTAKQRIVSEIRRTVQGEPDYPAGTQVWALVWDDGVQVASIETTL